jgi:hypothetical protein
MLHIYQSNPNSRLSVKRIHVYPAMHERIYPKTDMDEIIGWEWSNLHRKFKDSMMYQIVAIPIHGARKE